MRQSIADNNYIRAELINDLEEARNDVAQLRERLAVASARSIRECDLDAAHEEIKTLRHALNAARENECARCKS